MVWSVGPPVSLSSPVSNYYFLYLALRFRLLHKLSMVINFKRHFGVFVRKRD